MDAFHGPADIDSPYVDGISITYGQSPRQHIWTYAIGLLQNARSLLNCPCARFPGQAPPAFVGSDYYCESGNPHSDYFRGWYLDSLLWDGICFAQSNCCNQTGMPYFTRRLGESLSDNIEVRLCCNQPTRDENFGVKKLELFIR